MHATTPDTRPAAMNLRPHKQRPPRAPLAVSFKLTRRKLSFTQPSEHMPIQHMPSLELAPCPESHEHGTHDTHSAYKAFSELCLRTD
jgi:hypothetical protein